MTEPVIAVGVLTSPLVRFALDGAFTGGWEDGSLTGAFTARASAGHVVIEGDAGRISAEDGVLLEPRGDGPHAVRLEDVTIGVQFHWEQKQHQWFTGSLRLVVDGNNLAAVNVVPVEEYLTSVIASEMSAASALTFLKAHAITSRSWLLAQMEKSRSLKASGAGRRSTLYEDQERRIRWYDREDHELFDVCADDHCQRYQGMTRATSSKVGEAVQATRGLVLMYDGHVCDARFSKACGGVTEDFEQVWEPVRHPYLTAVADIDSAAIVHTESPGGSNAGPGDDASPSDNGAGGLSLSGHVAAEQWIRSSPPAFCNTSDPAILSRVLVNFDRQTRDFYRWKVEYGQDQLAELVRRKSGIDFGAIRDLVPVLRGSSGRIIELRVVGTNRTMVIGKELEIRKLLSPSHLYSSAFVVDALDRRDGIPGRFVLTGAGWGHGVGLCQIGAAVMGEMGYSHEQILKQYFTGAEIKVLY